MANSDFLKIVKNRKYQIVATVILFLVILILSSWMRTQNLPLLKDQTTGEYIPAALDPFYWLRIAQTIVTTGGLPTQDPLRIIPGGTGWSNELMPRAVIFLYQVFNIFGDYTLQYVDVISPVIFYALGLIVFFFLCLYLTKSKIASLISSLFLAFIPAYLYRTTAGFSDHEAIGMLAFFSVMLVYVLALNYLGKDKKMWHAGLWGLGVAFLTGFTIASWGGVANFIFLILPFSFFILWILENKDEDKKGKEFLVFYATWLLFTLLLIPLFGFSISEPLDRFVLGSNGILGIFILGFIIVDYCLLKLKERDKIKSLNKYRILASLIIILLLGGLGLLVVGKSIISIFVSIFNTVINPIDAGRVGKTVAENAQPYLSTWIGQTGSIFFWIFLGALSLFGFEISKKIMRKKNKIFFMIVWIILVFGLIFSSYSPDSVLNGNSLLSKGLMIIILLLFFGYVAWIYFNDNVKIDSKLIFIFSWIVIMLITARATIRVFFAVIPLFTFLVGFELMKLLNYAKENKEETMKVFLWVVIAIAIVSMAFSINNLTRISMEQVKYTGPSATTQWQDAMNWTRNNTPEGSLFVHWWDYGYWVEYLGERPTIADGGHFEGEFRDHLIGRYLLTEPNPDAALSFMKSNNISYLLIDPTDLGKYSAYSSIGSDVSGTDRLSGVPIMLSDSSQMQETSNGTIRVYQGGSAIDGDIVYNDSGRQIFLPSGKAAIIGIIIESTSVGQVKQPTAVFYYNNVQTRIPVQYIEIAGQFFDFGSGLDATIKVIPEIYTSSNKLQVDSLGTVLYLSPKVSPSLFSQLYLLNDPKKEYSTIDLAYSAQDEVVKSLNQQGANLPEIVYYQGFRGPIKIWKTDYPSNVLVHDEFLATSGEYASLDNLTFTK